MQSETLTTSTQVIPGGWRVRYWAGTLGKFVSTQLLVQALAVAGGIVLVRALPHHEYAYYTLAFSMLSTMNILADSGISIGLTSIGGRVWQDPVRFGQLISTALRLRKYLAGVAIIVIAPILFWVLTKNGASVGYTVLLTLLVLISLSLQLTTAVWVVAPRLHSQVNRVQILDLCGAVARLILICVAYFVFLNAAVAVLATVVSVAVQYFLLWRWTPGLLDTKAAESKEDRNEITSIVKSQVPNSIFYCLQGQITVWLVAFFGSTQSIAEIGALGRLGVLFGVITAVMTSIVLPSFARCQSRTQLRSRYLSIIAGFAAFGLLLILAARFFPDQVLWILGGKYAHLRNALLLMMGLTAFSSLNGAMWSLNSTKAWVKRSWLCIPSTILAQIVLLTILDIATLEGVLWFGILSLVPSFILNALLTIQGLSNFRLNPTGLSEQNS